MKKILEAFAQDNICTDSQYFSHDSDYGQIFERLVDTEGQLRDLLDEKGKELLEGLAKAQADINCITSTDRFVYGYRLGMLMMMEVLLSSNELIEGD